MPEVPRIYDREEESPNFTAPTQPGEFYGGDEPVMVEVEYPEPQYVSTDRVSLLSVSVGCVVFFGLKALDFVPEGVALGGGVVAGIATGITIIRVLTDESDPEQF
jgi:hypothetical protein